MARQRPVLPAPTPARVARIPDVATADLDLARVTWADHAGMWWFASRSDDPDEAGRFDLRRPDGTCYFASDPVAALIEKLWDPDDLDPVVSTVTLQRLVVWTGRLVRPPSVADTTARASRLPKELGTVTPYEPAWAWADALRADGRGGLRWWLRFDPGQGRGVAVFGPVSSSNDLPDAEQWPDLDSSGPAVTLRDRLEAVFDVVEDVPGLDQLEPAVPPDAG